MINKLFKKNNLFWRTWHRRLSVVFILPLILVAATGFMLAIRSYIPAIQPPQMKSAVAGFPAVSLEDVWENIRTLPEGGKPGLDDLKSIEVKVNAGVLNFRFKNGHEVQVDGKTGQILSSKKRWTPLLVQLHEGTFLPDYLRNIIFVPLGIILLFLCISGLYLAWPFLKNKKF